MKHIKFIIFKNMKVKYLPFLILPFIVFGIVLSSSLGVRAQQYHPDHKIDICHATSSFTNPYTTNNVDKNSTVGGHGDHTGQLWYEGITTKDWGDIIPPFDYIECPSEKDDYTQEYCETDDSCKQGNKCAAPIEGTYPGLNWPEGQTIWENDCKATEYENCDEEIAIEGSWTDWMTYDEDTLYKKLVTKYYDYYDQTYLCREETEREFKEIETPEEPEEPEEPETPETPEEPETPVEEEPEEEEPEEEEPVVVVEDTPEVLGEKDEPTEEIEEVGVVLGETGASSNIFVYIIQSVLSLSTILSGIFFSKKYIM